MNLIVYLLLPLCLSLLITALLIPCWIRVCNKWNLYEMTDERKQHRHRVPTLGGMAIYAGIIISYLILGQELSAVQVKYLIAASLILYFTGFFDDLLDLPPGRKLLLQVLAAGLIAFGGTRITNLYGIIGIEEIPLFLQYPITILFIVGITNAYNLVDGIDGLAGSLGTMSAVIFGVLFYQYDKIDFAILSFCMAGALIGFLKYNFHPAKIFMGDTGSLIIGFLLASQAISLLNINEFRGDGITVINPALIAAVLFVPVYDVLRVSVIRILTGYSPFRPDRNHVHHMIIGQGFGQRVTTVLIVVMNLVFVLLAFLFSSMNINLFILMSLCIGMITINTLVMTWLAGIYGKLGGRLYGRPSRAITNS
ncbi:MraY family glycosyltransferase [soil metagenome]